VELSIVQRFPSLQLRMLLGLSNSTTPETETGAFPPAVNMLRDRAATSDEGSCAQLKVKSKRMTLVEEGLTPARERAMFPAGVVKETVTESPFEQLGSFGL